MLKKLRGNQRGFTVIELLIGLVVMGLIILVVVPKVVHMAKAVVKLVAGGPNVENNDHLDIDQLVDQMDLDAGANSLEDYGNLLGKLK